MKFLVKNIAAIIILIMIASNGFAQKYNKNLYPFKNGLYQFKYEVGTSVYKGDLSSSKIDMEHYSFPVIRPNIKAGLSTYIWPYWVFSTNIFYMNVKGADDPANKWSNGRGTDYNRGMSFSTHITGIESLLSFPIFLKHKKNNFGLEPKIGLALLNYVPITKFSGERYNLRKVGTFGQNFDANVKNYSRFTVAIPFGVTLVYDLNSITHITFSYHSFKLFTDYIDDVGNDKFITSEFINENNLEVTEDFMKIANPNNQSGYRSNTDRFDFVYTVAVGMNVEVFRNWKYRKWE